MGPNGNYTAGVSESVAVSLGVKMGKPVPVIVTREADTCVDKFWGREVEGEYLSCSQLARIIRLMPEFLYVTANSGECSICVFICLLIFQDSLSFQCELVFVVYFRFVSG